MNKETLEKANKLNRLIKEHENALSCFEYDCNYWNDDAEPDMRSTDPQLIIEHLDLDEMEGRVQTPIPMVLSDYLIEAIKASIKDNLIKLKAEFNEL